MPKLSATGLRAQRLHRDGLAVHAADALADRYRRSRHGHGDCRTAPSCLDSESFSLGQDGSEKMKHVHSLPVLPNSAAATHLVV